MTDPRNTAEFVRLFGESQRRMYAYIRGQVGNTADADDVLGQVSTVLWKKFDSFEPGTDFIRWGCRIARLEVLAHHRNRQRLAPVFSDTLAKQIEEEFIEVAGELNERFEALGDCMRKLSSEDRKLIERRYRDEQSVATIAGKIKRTKSTVYKSLARIHDALFDCIESTIDKGSE